MTATIEETTAALQALSHPDRLRLLLSARWRVRGLGRAALGRRAEDLLSEACLRVCEGRRHWDPGAVSFVGFLIGAMRSISSHWREECSESEAYLASELRSDHPAADPVENARSQRPDAERTLVAKDTLDAINGKFRDDPEVLLVIEGLGEGMKGPAIQEALGLTPDQYEAAFKRMRRGARRVRDEGGQGHA